MSVGSTHHLEMVFVWKQNYILVDEYFFFCCTWIVNSALIKTQHHSSEWYCRFVTVVTEMPEVLGFWRMAGEYDYLMRVQVADMKRYDEFYKRLVNSVPGLSDVTSSFAMEQIKYTTSLPIE